MARRRIDGVVEVHTIAWNFHATNRCFDQTAAQRIRIGSATCVDDMIEELMRHLAVQLIEGFVMFHKPVGELVPALDDDRRRQFHTGVRE